MDLLIDTLTLRPYVFAFMAAFVVLALHDLGRRRTVAFTASTLGVAWTAEFVSTRVGFPFGLYYYTGVTRSRELYLSNVPVFDPVSFVFLAYASYCLARLMLGRARGLPVVAASAVFMMLLDVLIDPLAVRGDRWFLGRVLYYPDGGVLFGCPCRTSRAGPWWAGSRSGPSWARAGTRARPGAGWSSTTASSRSTWPSRGGSESASCSGSASSCTFLSSWPCGPVMLAGASAGSRPSDRAPGPSFE